MKRYLKTQEEVTQALREGKTVQTNEMEYGIINNLIVGFDKIVREIYINPAIRLSEKPYIEEPEPLKLEVGKFYRTRDGRKVVVTYITSGFPDRYPVCVLIMGTTKMYWVKIDGLKDTGNLALDLVAPWEG